MIRLGKVISDILLILGKSLNEENPVLPVFILLKLGFFAFRWK